MVSPVGFIREKISVHCHLVPRWRQTVEKLFVYVWKSKDKVLQEEEEITHML